ncbi:sugar phosphate isomerase/epimerase family protein [Labrys monachus]|uniref:Sugar phosphate isomerase/epimerase n=1 Tax=Labrys monachus TaxID=217067 RepID=A0ABU0FNN0_9HYPH|nr:sugar phosphate isomerase/epimerase [Labrys monachus]MDQ0396219.1 sugar phosphate isomerase/epimerase [Labrys monachus]
MQLGIFAKTFSGTMPDAVMNAARLAGYQAVQYNMACSGLASMPSAIPDQAADAVRAAAIEHGIAVVAVSATYNMIHPDPAVRARGHESLRVIAGSAHRMGTRLLTLCTGTRDPDDQWRAHPDNEAPQAWGDLLDAMTVAVAVADEHDVDLGIEPELANVVNSAAKARSLIDEVNSPRLKIVLDPANLFESEPLDAQRRIVAAGIALLADRIALAHAKDRDARGRFATAGTGVLDYDHYLKCLAHAGFDGPLVTHGLAAGEASDVARFLQQQIAGLPA